MRYRVVVQPQPGGGFTAVVPALPGCVTWGPDLQRARDLAADAIEAHVANLKKHGQALPDEDPEKLEGSLLVEGDLMAPNDDVWEADEERA